MILHVPPPYTGLIVPYLDLLNTSSRRSGVSTRQQEVVSKFCGSGCCVSSAIASGGSGVFVADFLVITSRPTF